MAEQDTIRPDQQLIVAFQQDVKPKTVVMTALKIRSLYNDSLATERNREIDEDREGLSMDAIPGMEINPDVPKGTRLTFTAPRNASPRLLNDIREMYTKKD